MIGSFIGRLTSGCAVRTLLGRVGVVGGNFAVMMALAVWLGLDAFGQIAVLWGLAMVAGTVVSVGAPLLLLRILTDGGGVTAGGLWRQIALYPAGLAAVALLVLPRAVPDVPWVAVMLAGLAVNAATCVASVMRGLGSVQLSMLLRDGLPQLALGAAAVLWGPAAGGIMAGAAVIMGGAATLLLVICLRRPAIGALIQPGGDGGAIRYGLWGTAVLGMAAAQVDIIVGGSILRADQIGLYALLRRVANLVALPVSVATWVSAVPISAAFGMQDRTALRQASAAGSRIALLPGAVLFLAALLLLPWVAPFAGQTWSVEARSVALVLLCGAVIQVFLASGMTVATLCGFERFAFGARLLGLFTYLGMVVWSGSTLSALGNAAAYVSGIASGGLLLWALLWARLAIDTSGAALWRAQRGQTWKLP